MTRADDDELMEVMRLYLHVRALSNRYVQCVNAIPYSLKTTKLTAPEISVIQKELLSLSKSLGIEQTELEQKLAAHLAALRARKEPTRALVRLVENARQDFEGHLHIIPPSHAKASAYFRAELERRASPDFSVYFYSELKHIDHPALKATVDWFKHGVPGRTMSVASPLSGLDQDLESRQQFSFYRFFEKYAADKERNLLRDIEASFREFLTSVLTELDVSKKPASIGPALEHVGEHLWLVSRSEGLTQALLPQIRQVIDRLPRWQNDDGYWPADTTVGTCGHRLVPSVYATALCTLILQKLSDDRHNDSVSRAIDWLLQHDQGAAGAETLMEMKHS